MSDPRPTSAEEAIIAVLASNPDATNTEIGQALGKSERTVENQLRRLYKRLGLNNKTYNKRRFHLLAWIAKNRET